MKINIGANKTYKTRENAEKAVEAKGATDMVGLDGYAIRWFVHQGEDGRYFPVFLGQNAVQAGLHFHFSVVG